MENPIQKLTQNLKEPQIAKTGLEGKTWKPTHPNFKSHFVATLTKIAQWQREDRHVDQWTFTSVISVCFFFFFLQEYQDGK